MSEKGLLPALALHLKRIVKAVGKSPYLFGLTIIFQYRLCSKWFSQIKSSDLSTGPIWNSLFGRDISRLPEILQPFGESAVAYTEILGTATNTPILVIEIVLNASSLNCLSCCFAIMRSSFNTMLLLYHALSIGIFLILTCSIYILTPKINPIRFICVLKSVKVLGATGAP